MTTAAQPSPTESLQRLQRVLRGMVRPAVGRRAAGPVALTAATQQVGMPLPKVTVKVAMPWGPASLVYPPKSRLYRPAGGQGWGLVLTPRGELFEVSQAHPKGHRVKPEHGEILASMIDAGQLVHDGSITF